MMNPLKIFLTIIILCFISQIATAENGSILLLKKTYFYKNKNKAGGKIFTKKKQAYDVIEISTTSKNSLMFKIVVNTENNVINGSGYIMETDEELHHMELKKVKVYPVVPLSDSDLTKHQYVPSNQLSFTGIQKKSPDFTNLTWRAVNYKTNAHKQYWVADWAGVYRPNKKADWLTSIYKEAKRQNIDSKLLNKILMGFVETGFTKDQVRMSLGIPLKEQQVENSTNIEWIYSSQKIVFKDNLVLRVL